MTMKTLMIAATATLLTAAPLVAQERGAGGDDARGYVTGLGGFATSVTNTTGDVRVATHRRQSPWSQGSVDRPIFLSPRRRGARPAGRIGTRIGST